MIEDIRNFLQLNENLLSSGMPTAEQMKAIAETGVKVFIRRFVEMDDRDQFFRVAG